MKPFLDSGFLLTLLFDTNGTQAAREISRRFEGPLWVGALQVFTTRNRLRREIQAVDATTSEGAMAATALRQPNWFIKEDVFQIGPLDYQEAIELATEWDAKNDSGLMVPALLLLWPAMAVTAGATDFLSFDPRTRELAQAAGLRILPERL
jgi:hypothetical protein